MGTVAVVLSHKGDAVHTIEPGATVFDAIERMASENVGALVVVKGEEIVGIITERDYLRSIALKNRSSRSTDVSTIMSSPVHCAAPTDAVTKCLALMTGLHCRHLPIVEEDRLVGIVSIGDLVRHQVSEQEEEIHQLQEYIQGTGYQ